MASLASDFVASITGLFKITAGDILGVLFAVVVAEASKHIAKSSAVGFLGEIGRSAQLWAILLGMAYGNTLHGNISQPKSGLTFCKKKLLKIGIILYGFKVRTRGSSCERHASKHVWR